MIPCEELTRYDPVHCKSMHTHLDHLDCKGMLRFTYTIAFHRNRIELITLFKFKDAFSESDSLFSLLIYSLTLFLQ